MNPEKFVVPDLKVERWAKQKPSFMHNLFRAGQTVELQVVKMVAVQRGEVVPVATPNADPYLIVGDTMSNHNGVRRARYFATNGEDYYDLIQMANGMSAYANHLPTDDDPDELTKWRLAKTDKEKLTNLHQKVVKVALEQYMKDRLEKE